MTADASSAAPDSSGAPKARARARDPGIPFEGEPGPLNAITDVPGVEVGHVTLIRGEPEYGRRIDPG